MFHWFPSNKKQNEQTCSLQLSDSVWLTACWIWQVVHRIPARKELKHVIVLGTLIERGHSIGVDLVWHYICFRLGPRLQSLSNPLPNSFKSNPVPFLYLLHRFQGHSQKQVTPHDLVMDWNGHCQITVFKMQCWQTCREGVKFLVGELYGAEKLVALF